MFLAQRAIGYIQQGAQRRGHLKSGARLDVLLVLAGVVTTFPLIWFASGARRLPYSVVGLCQYLAPSLAFLLAVLYYGEPFTRAYAIAFSCIWTALAIFAFDMVARQRRA